MSLFIRSIFFFVVGMSAVTLVAAQTQGKNPSAASPTAPSLSAIGSAKRVASGNTVPAKKAKAIAKKPGPKLAAASTSCVASPSSPAVTVAEQKDAMADFVTLKSTAACSPGFPATCAAVSVQLAKLVADANKAWTALTMCSINTNIKLSDTDRSWYAGRASVWKIVDLEQKANSGVFTDGTYTLPPPLFTAIDNANTSVYTYPIINVPPIFKASVNDGDQATLFVTADPNGSKSPLKYAWFKNGVAVDVAANDDPTKDAKFTIPATVAADNGAKFTVQVTNDAGSVTSQPALLAVTGTDAATESGTANTLAAEFSSIVLHQEAICIVDHNSSCLASLQIPYTTFKGNVEAAKVRFPNIELDLALGTQKPAPSVACASASESEPSSVTWLQGYDRLARASATTLARGRFAFCKPDITGTVAHTRVLAGVDVSAASSADPAARFLLEAALDLPLTKTTATAPLDAAHWLWGYVRLSSIASPGAISGTAAPSTYLNGLTSAAPNAIVQSFEANAGYKLKLAKWDSSMGQRPMLFSFIVGGGVITPLSDVQAGSPSNPLPIYTVTPALQSFYSHQAATDPSTVNIQNLNAINVACGLTATIPSPFPACYFSQYPEARNRFFRNYGAGFRLERYYYNGLNHSFIFPAVFDATIGQNDYVTGGELHRLVTHIAGSTPLPAIGSLHGLYVYAALDIELSRNVNSATQQQFLFTSAPASITPSSSNFAAVFVGQPDRDRYRFGIAYDLTTLIGILTTKKQ